MAPPLHARYVVDASVVVKWFVRRDEPDRERALALRDLHVAGRTRLSLPDFGLLEVLNAIRWNRQSTETDTLRALTGLLDLGLDLAPLDGDLLRKATAIAWAYDLALYDAAYVALAERLGHPFITADDALCRRMKGHSIVLRLRDLAFE